MADPFDNPLMKLKAQIQPHIPKEAEIIDIQQHPWDKQKLNVRIKINQSEMVIEVKAKRNEKNK